MQLVVNTDGGFYGHYLRVRRWYGVSDPPAKRGGLCKPCQTILWGTLFAAIVSPLVGIGWLLARAFDKVTAGGGNAVMRSIGRCRIANGSTWAKECGVQELAKIPVPLGAALGLITLVMIAIAVLLVGVFGFGLWHVSDITAWIKDAAVWIGGASLTAGWLVFAGLAYVGLALNAIGGAILQGAAWAIENRLWLSGWAVTILTPMAIAAILSWAFIWFCLSTKLGAMLLVDPAKRLRQSHKLAAEMRKSRREEARKWSCTRCGHRNAPWRNWCNPCGEERVCSPPGPIGRLSRWLRGRGVAGTMHVMGAGSTVWAFVGSLAKGACPLVEFLSPEELRERALAVAKKDRARRAEIVRRILGRSC